VDLEEHGGGLRAGCQSAPSLLAIASRCRLANCVGEQAVERGSCDDDASTEGECRDLTTSDAEICAGSGDAEKFGDLGDGVGAAFVHGSLLGGMDDTEKRVGAA
jgi:hypothetical protein